MSKISKDNIIQSLIKNHKLSKKDVNDAIALQGKKNISLDKAFIEEGLVKEEDVLSLFIEELNIPFINLSKYKIDPDLKDILPERAARQYRVVPISTMQRTMTVAVDDPFNFFMIDDLRNITGKNIDIVISTSSGILKALDNYYGVDSGASITEIRQDINVGEFEIVSDSDDGEVSDGVINESEQAPVIRMVNLVIREALKQRASDIHIEPMADNVRVRYRIDGVLREILTIPKENQNAVIVRIKIMGLLDITASQIPQDGRFKLKLGNKEVDFRVSLLPTSYGQKVVMRVLDKANLSVGLDGLGVSEQSLKAIREAIHKPFGMVIVTGPTGSGKSTTLYSIINELNTVERNIITVEDPVEYLIEGLTQIQARPEIGLTFATGLKAMLRQSPDIVMVGEIRDNETADIAIKASLTGQMVFSTLHTNDASGALTRLIDMGVEPFLVASSIVLASAQRLCRKICPSCKAPVKIDQEVLDKMNYEFEEGAIFYEGKGCESCRKTGYRGRICITEVLEIDDQIRNMLLNGESADKIKIYACKEKGMATLWEDAVYKWSHGITTLEEVLRVTTED